MNQDALVALQFVFYNPFFMFLWGACWGSFLNVVMFRYPLGRSVVSPPSACPNCKKQIAPYDNIPVFSWFILRGRCRNCKQPYSIRYALYEAGFGLVCCGAALLYPNRALSGLALGHFLLAAIPLFVLWRRIGRGPWYLVVCAGGCGLLYGFQLLFP